MCVEMSVHDFLQFFFESPDLQQIPGTNMMQVILLIYFLQVIIGCIYNYITVMHISISEEFD